MSGPYPFPGEKKQKQPPFLGEDHRAAAALRPGPQSPRPARLLPLAALCREDWPRLLSPRAQGAPGPDAAKTRRGPARESPARLLPAPHRLGARRSAAAQPGAAPGRRDHQGLGASAPTGPGRAAGRAGAAAPGPPGGSRRRSAPSLAPAFSRPGARLPLHRLARRGRKRSRRAGAGCGHKSPCGPSFPLLARGGSGPAWPPGRTRHPAFRVTAWGPPDGGGNRAKSLPFCQREGTASPS